MIGKRGESPACPFYTGEITMEINFIFQMNSFHRFKRENPLSAHAQALWVELFGLFNARRFPEEMPVSTTHLCAILGLSKDTVLRARRELAENNLISVERGASGRAASVVKMVYFKKDCEQICGEPVENDVENLKEPGNADENGAHIDENCDGNKDGNFASQESAQVATQKKVCVANIGANCDTYTNPNGAPVTQNVCEDDEEAAELAERARMLAREGMRKHFGREGTKGEIELIALKAASESGVQDCTGLIEAAFEVAGRYGAAHPAQYCAKLIDDWRSGGLYLATADEARLYMQLSQSARETDGEYRDEIEADIGRLRKDCARAWIRAFQRRHGRAKP